MGSKSTRRWIAIGAAGTLGLSFIAASAANAAADTELHVSSASHNGSQHSPSLIGNGPVIVHVHHNGNADVPSISSAPVH